MIGKNVINNIVLSEKSNANSIQSLNIFNEIHLHDIFSEEEVEKLMKESVFSNYPIMEENEEDEEGSRNINKLGSNICMGLTNNMRLEESKEYKGQLKNKSKIKQSNFDRLGLILKFLQLSIEKLNKHKEITTAKGLEWVRSEIQDSLVFKSDEKTIKHFEKLKENNQDIHITLNWVEEFSSMNANQKEIINTIKKKSHNYTSSSKNCTLPIPKNSYLSNYFTNEKLDKFQFNTNTNLENFNSCYGSKLNYATNNVSFINFPEDCILAIEDPEFDIFQLDKTVGKENTLSTISCYIFITMGLYSFINYSNFENFIDYITKGYSRQNPYHTDLHAADVEQTCYIFLKYGHIKEVLNLTELDCAAFLISAIIHDYKHPGLNNAFLINSKNDISIIYNDQSVLENFHVSEAFKIINSHPDSNIFSELTPEEYKIMRKRIIECVLATDMTLHNKEYSYMKLKLETFDIKAGENIEKIFENLDSIGVFNTQQEFLNTLVHTADISNPTKPLHVYLSWAELVMEEFWQQGDKEKELKLPISFLCDRTTTKLPAAQLGFMDGIVSPLVQIVVTFFPGLHFLIDNINSNKLHFKKLKGEDDKNTQNAHAQAISPESKK